MSHPAICRAERNLSGFAQVSISAWHRHEQRETTETPKLEGQEILFFRRGILSSGRYKYMQRAHREKSAPSVGARVMQSIAQGDVGQACRQLEAAVRQRPSNATLRLQLAVLHISKRLMNDF